MKGRVFDIQRFSIYDGPGIRTTVFLKGCDLRCLWCHNPESISPKPQLSWTLEKCIACGECFPVCPEAALARRGDGKAVVDWLRCTGCGDCVKVCDAKALEMIGRDMTVEEVMSVVLRDRDYYVASGGGITLSGGEPLYQPDFCEALLGAAKAERLHCSVETSGLAEWRSFERLLPVVDLFLYDFKETNPQLHTAFIGKPNSEIVANLRALHRAGASILLRCPMIPEYNARKEHLDGIAALARELPHLKGVEILPYHRLGRAKLKRLGMVSRMPESVKPPDEETVQSWLVHLRKQGVRLVNQATAAEARL
ncbi:MAG: glycyl-radical enzyme activating protein [Acidobacteria bacterium]|nr:glycyl-radical enzyme activating protein [Acidobacteriota bacterium]